MTQAALRQLRDLAAAAGEDLAAGAYGRAAGSLMLAQTLLMPAIDWLSEQEAGGRPGAVDDSEEVPVGMYL